jgi:hypothetical protein
MTVHHDWGIRRLYTEIKRDAKRRHYDFNLRPEWLSQTSKQPCHYCGDPPKNVIRSRAKSGINLVFIYNGLDRMDNSVGYSEQNCVPCCIICNRAKNSMGYDEFLKWRERLIAHGTAAATDQSET